VVKRWVDAVLLGAGANAGRLLPFAAALVLAMAALLFASRTLLVALSQESLGRLRDAAAERILFGRLPALRRFPAGDLLSRVFSDASMLSALGENLLRRLVGDALVALGAVVMMFVLAPRLALAACVVAPVVGLLLARLGGAIRRRGREAQEGAGKLTATLSEQVRGVTAIRGLLAEGREAARFAEEDASYVRAVLEAERGTSLLIASVFAAAAAGFLLAVNAGGGALAAQRITPGALLAFCLYAGQTVEPLRRLAEVHGLLQRGLGAADRLFDVIDLPLEPDSREAPREGKTRLSGTLRVEGLRFRYHHDAPLLEGVDLIVREGERLGLASASGGGKSTLARLLVRLEEARGGRVLLGGDDLASLSLRDVRRAVHVVEPEPFVLAGSLFENLCLAEPGVTRERALDALRTAGLAPLLASLPRGLDEPVGEAGRLLSSGERARVALARALLLDPAVVVFDEATAALDGDTEDALFDAIGAWLNRRAAIVVSHRLATLRRCSSLALLSGGRIAAAGPFADVERSPLFSSILGGQAGEPAAARGDILPPVRTASFHVPVSTLAARGRASQKRQRES